jgi:CheY-like chemotaxis protein
MGDRGRIRVTFENEVIWGKTPLPLNPGRFVKIVISDDGPGIPPTMLPHVFDPFFSTKESGRGLGLTSCFSILRRHSGHIAAATDPEGGARFTVYLPALDASLPAPEEKEEGPGRVEGHGRILVMDDEPVVRDVAGQMLRLLGYEPAFAEDGDTAVQRYGEARKEGRPFRAVIMDLTVPGGRGGRETIGDLLALDPEAVAVASSGYSEEPVMAHCREHGFRGALPKPYTMETLGRVLAELLPG